MHISHKAKGLLLITYFINVSAASAQEPEKPFPFDTSHAQDSIESSFYLGLESHYLSEGRDALDGDSLLVSSFETSWKNITGGVWYGYSPDQRYDELQLALALTHSIGDFEIYGGYTHLRSPLEGSHDNEIGAGVAWSGLPMEVELSADVYYSFGADGYFAEISAGRDFTISDELTLNVSAPFGINQGYVVDGHDGANNIALRLGAEYALSDAISITAHTTYSWALSRDKNAPEDELLVDFFHSGLALQWSF